MKKLHLTLSLLLTLTASAVEPGQPAYRAGRAYPNGLPERVSWRPNQPHYDRATWLHDADGVLTLVPFVVPNGMATIAGTQTYTLTDGVMVEAWDVDTQAEASARQQAAQVAQLQAIVDAAGDQIRQLEAIIDKYSIPRPASPMVCLAVIGAAKDAAKASNNAMGVAEAGADGVILLTLYSGMADAGVDATMVNAVWQYMVATGQDGQE